MDLIRCPGCNEENPAKFRLCGYCGRPLSAAPLPPALPVHEMRKTVTIVFSDLKDSTALGERIDTEALHEVKERYFSTMAAEIARHGGKVEKYIGDAIMAVFGLPKAHEDDALRAVRAAQGMRVALDKLNQGLRQRYGVALANRTGVNTGEVVANDDPGADQKLATGDAVNVAARLEQAAPVDQIYLGETTWRLVRDAVEVERVEPLALKGKSERVSAFRLVSAAGLDGNVRRVDTPLAGRDEELAALAAAWHAVNEGRAVRLVTVIGDAGLGKSRLVHEMIERYGADATVLRGRCLPYGDGITFWPLVEMASAHIRADDSPEQAQARLLELTGDADVAARLASAIGLSTEPYPLHELNWAARRFLQGLAAVRPVIALIDDIHWAEPAFLELIEHVLDAAEDAPILLLATARHELIEERPTWPDRPSASRLVLRPLSAAAAETVIGHLLGNAALPLAVVARIVTAAEGNPLYVEQMLSMLIDSRAVQHDDEALGLAGMAGLADHADDAIIVPPTIRALLEARLDRLGREERATVEPAAVVGVRFAQPAVESLAPEGVRAAVPRHLAALHHKQFIEPAEPGEPGSAFRFHHHLIRDTVYNGLLKRARANLHVAFVQWADQVNADRDRGLEYEEILGYHLEQAHRYLGELGPLDEQGVAIGADAAGRLANAARRALARGDMHAAANLFRRATVLLPSDDALRVELLPDFAETLMSLGDFAQARTVLAQAMQAAERTGNARIKAASEIVEAFVRLFSGESGDGGSDMLTIAHRLIPQLEREQAQSELASAWRLVLVVNAVAGRYQQANEAAEKSLALARCAGNERLIAKVSGMLANTALLGPTPVAQAIGQCEALVTGGPSRLSEGINLCVLAELRAMNGEPALARTLYQRSRAMLRDLEHGVNAASTGISVARIELLAGDLAVAEREIRADYEFLRKVGETYFLSTMAALLSQVVRELGRDEEALALSQVAEAATAVDDLESQALWRSIRAPMIARSGDLALAEELASTAVEMARRTEAPNLQADALAEQARVLHLAARPDAACRAISEAIALYTAKGNVAGADRARSWAGEMNCPVIEGGTSRS
jgi:class 3 adenylate cyclase/tetratricopeptide (TPR) repeat protein